ncbi:MAG: hypothetical protein Q4C34_08770 [Bacteroidales bacterium]|nr:hypothetical protein [Bacteroidales bacterium]
MGLLLVAVFDGGWWQGCMGVIVGPLARPLVALDPNPTPSLVPRSIWGYYWLPSSTAVFHTPLFVRRLMCEN